MIWGLSCEWLCNHTNEYIFFIWCWRLYIPHRNSLNTKGSKRRISKISYISWDRLFKDSSTGTDSYQVNIPEITSYAQIDGQVIRIRVDVENTTDASLEINWLWAKDITKFQWNPLQTWDILAWQIIEVVWDNDDDEREIENTIAQSKNVETDKLVADVVLWENVTAGDWLWAVFYGRWEAINTIDFLQSTWWVNTPVWNWTYIQIRDTIPVYIDENRWNILKSLKYYISKTWSPTDSLQFDLYDNTFTLIQNISTILWSTITTSYVETEVLLWDINLDAYKGQIVYILIKRTWWQSASNYYMLDSEYNCNCDYYNWSSRLWSKRNLKTKQSFWYLYWTDKVYLSDNRYVWANIVDWIVLESWISTEVKSMQTKWDLRQTSVIVWDSYYLNTTYSESTIWTPTTIEDNTEYSTESNWFVVIKTFIVDKSYIDKFDYQVHWTYYTSWENTRYVDVYLNGERIWGQSWQDTSYTNKSINIQRYVDAGRVDILLRAHRSPSRPAYIRNEVLTVQDYEWIIHSTFTNSIQPWYNPVLIWVWYKNTMISLMINENNYWQIDLWYWVENILLRADTARHTTSTVNVKVKEFDIRTIYNWGWKEYNSPYHITFGAELRETSWWTWVISEVYVNWVYVWRISNATSTYTFKKINLDVNPWDKIEIYLRRWSAAWTAYIQNARITYNIVYISDTDSNVVLD